MAPARLLLAVGAAALFGCPNEALAPLEPCTVSGVSDEIPVNGIDKVDILFMVDNSPSMNVNQGKLVDQLPKLVQILTSGDLNGDGKQDFPPAKDMHLGVTSCNMGSANLPNIPTCSGNGLLGTRNLGDDGLLLHQPLDPAYLTQLGLDATCNGFRLSSTSYLGFEPGAPGSPSAQQVADDFKCLAVTGVHGCGFEQQLEAVLKAVAPHTDCSFSQGTCGNGDGQNAGFLRSDAVFSAILITDEDDCSIPDQSGYLFNPTSNDPHILLQGGTRVGLNLRCAWAEGPYVKQPTDYPGMQPVSRYIEGLKALKPDNPDRVIFAAITGIPQELEGHSPDELLSSPQMQFTINPNVGRAAPDDDASIPSPACTYLKPDNSVGFATPGVRYVKTAKGFGDNGIVRSICSDDYSGALTQIIQKISAQLKGACLPHPLNPDSAGIVECNVVEILPAGQPPSNCDPHRGRVFLETRTVNGEQRTVCNINQVAHKTGTAADAFLPSPTALNVPDKLTGWFYDDFTDGMKKDCPMDTPQRISFRSNTPGIDAQPTDTTLRFECFQPVSQSNAEATGKDAVGSKCTPTGNECALRSDPQDAVAKGAGFSLTCDKTSNTCQIPCQQDAQCPYGWVCDPQGMFCVNPTCPPATTAQ